MIKKILISFLVFSNCEALEYLIKLKDFKEEFYLQGELAVKNKTVLRAPEAEQYSSFTVKTVLAEGTLVKKGQVILEFDDSDLQESLRKEKNNLKLENFSLKTIELELKKEKSKRKNNLDRKVLELKKAEIFLVSDELDLIPKIEQQKAKLEIKSAKLSLKEAQKLLLEFVEYEKSKLSVAKLNVEKSQKELESFQNKILASKIKSPSNGLLFYPYTKKSRSMSKVAKGSVVNMGDILLEIPDLSSFEAHVYLRQSESTQVKIGDKATLFLEADPANPVEAKLVKIARFATTRNERLGENGPSSKLKEIKVTFEVKNKKDYFTPGLSLQAQVISLKKKSCINIPWIYVSEKDNKFYVNLLNDGKLSEKEISLGIQGNSFVEVISGLNVGDLVATK
ncbi:MAG: hypothetical protein COB02_05155 [Candidatus Cloacimonadota bacterium]|nr:MAG: hypothetical protein COB02_05155 [Candidatus Cloacimonadota bacterium]